jgi:hypothetical protein
MSLPLKHPRALLLKAELLVREGMVRPVSPLMYVVREPSYKAPAGLLSFTVERASAGKPWRCSCDGFKRRRIGFCSHVLAVMTVESQKRGGE